MNEENTAVPAEDEGIDIFLCTRDLPDELTAETAALRQLCAALLGEGYRVFFPPAALAGKTPEEAESLTQKALSEARVMVAAAVGDEGAADEKTRALWSAFRDACAVDPKRSFVACLRDAENPPAELEGAELFDMAGLSFLAELKQRLTAALAEPEPEPEKEIPPARRRWPWVLLAAAGVAIVALILIFCLK